MNANLPGSALGPHAKRAPWLVLAGALLLATSCSRQPAFDAAAIEKAIGAAPEGPAPVIFERAEEAEGARVLFVGIDGATWKVIGPMLDAGELPTLGRLLKQGASDLAFAVGDPRSPVAWTDMATGRSPRDHGIRGFVTQLPDGTFIPVSGAQRRTPALWEVADRHGLESGVIGWWAAWPADPVRGWIVTDHANPVFAQYLRKDSKYWTADIDDLAGLGRDYHPADIAPVLARHWVDTEAYPITELLAQARLSPAQAEMAAKAPFNERTLYSLFKTGHAVDWPLSNVAVELLESRPPDLAMVYFRGPDPVQHYGWDLVQPELYAQQPAHLERDRGVVEAVYRYIDSFLGKLLRVVGEDTWIVVASDHGAEPAPGSTDEGATERPGGHTRNAKGILCLHGPHVRRGVSLEGAHPYDLAPTIAWLMGFVVSEELEGRVLTEAFEPDFVAGRPIRTLPTWGPRPVRPAERSEADEAMMESLRALGYVQ